MKIYNTLTHKKEEFKPRAEKQVNLFVCGPTVYDYSHLGHAKTYTQFDFIVRYLRHLGYEVFYLQNITNIDDKIIARAKERNIAWDELAADYEQRYYQDMEALHNASVTKYARATDYIPQIVGQVKVLLDKGFAYKTDDGIYFEVAKFEGYGKLSGRTEVKEEDALSRIDEDPAKRGWNDFALWKFSSEGEPSWDTDLGRGRPGWHIEDTAITETEFGPQYDIHGGAVDLIFPHHEAEITQMEAASGKSPLAKYWLHAGFLNTGSTKMSKSLGNFETIESVLKKYHYRTLRYFFLSSHYRSPLDFTDASLADAKNSLERLDEFIFKIDPDYDDAEDEARIETARKEIEASLDDDFNTPGALATFFEFVRSANAAGKAGKRTLKLFEDLNELFDIFNFKTEASDVNVEALVKQRDALREKGDFEAADKIREQLESKGIRVYDTPDGTKWRKIS